MAFFDSLKSQTENVIDKKITNQNPQEKQRTKHLDLKPEYSNRGEIATSAAKRKRNFWEHLELHNEKYFLRSSKNREKKTVAKKDDESNTKLYEFNHCKYSSSTHAGYR